MRRFRQTGLLTGIVVGMFLPAPALAQQVATSVPGMSLPKPAVEEEHSWAGADSNVAFLDSALPRSHMRLRFDLDYSNRRPTRAEFLYPKGGLPGSPGMPLPETQVHAQELFYYVEMAPLPDFSFFVEQPWRWVNPEVNRNEGGWGDFNFGLKWLIFADDALLTTLQFRTYVPTSDLRALGTEHVTIEPAVLVNFRLAEYLTLEGEFRYWLPIGGTDFVGDVVRYGLGLVYGQRCPDEIWITPVAELVGWTVLDGQAMIAQSPTSFTVVDAGGHTILNAHLGIRLGFSDHADLYAGYGRALSGHAWYRDTARLEFRFFF